LKTGYQPRINIVKDENSNLLADSQSVWNRWKNYLRHLLNVHGINNVMQTKIRTSKPLVLETGSFDV